MAVISTTFKMVDDMSDKLANLGTAGRNVTQELTNIGTSSSSLDKLSTSAEKSTDSLVKTTHAVDEQDTAFAEHRTQIENSSEQLGKFVTSADNASKATEELNENLTSSSEKINEILADTESSAKSKAMSIATIFQDEGFSKSESLKKAWSLIDDQIDDTTEKTEEFGDTNKTVFADLEGIIASAGIVAFLKKVADGYNECIDAASEYETYVAKVSTLADTNVLSIGDMSDEMLDLSQKTGQAASSLAEAEYQALSAGVATQNATGFVEDANKLAVGGFTETATAVDVLTTALNAYQLDASETNRISDTLIMTQNLGKTTVDELASNMGRVIPSAAAYNVSIEDLSTAYAILTANGIATAESTTYLKGMFNELGDTGSTVSKTLKEQTGESFDELKANGASLGDIIGILSKSVNGNSTAFANLWSSQEAGIGALSLLTSGTEKYNSVLEKMQNSTGTVDEAYKAMTSTAAHSAQELTTAVQNTQIAIGTSLLPLSTKLNNAMTTILNGVTGFVNENPGLVRGITAVSVAIGVVTAAVVAYNLITKLATLATAAFTAVMDANPLFLVATAIAAVVAGMTTLVMAQEEEVDEMDGMTTSTKLLKEQLDDTKRAYDEACETYGKNSAEAEELKYKVDELSTAYDNGKQSVEDFSTKCNEAISDYEETKSKYYDTKTSIDNEEESTGNLVNRLEELASKSKLSADEQRELSTVIDVLNQKVPGLNLSIEDVNGNLTDTITKIKALSSQNVAEDRYKNAYDSYNNFLKEQPTLYDNASEATKQLSDAQVLYNEKLAATEEAEEAYNKALEEHDSSSQEVLDASMALADAQGEEADAFEDYNDALERANETRAYYNDNLTSTQDALDELTDAYAEKSGIIIDTTNEAAEAAGSAIISQNENMQALAEEYDEVYQAAYNSFSGQYNLWDEADNKSTTSVSTLMSNLDSQITYWENYSNNLENLHKRNIEGLDELVSSMDDGSEESAAALSGMANASDEELKKMVSKYSELQGEQDRTATNAAEMKTNFTERLGEMSDEMKTSIDKMNLSTDATTAAKHTIDAYVAEIQNGVGRASSAASAVAAAAASALSSGSSSSSTPKHARGTDYGEDIYIAGEEGPELIVGREGSKVYTAEETQRILNQSFHIDDPYSSVSTSGRTVDTPVVNSNGGDRTVTIKLEGIGEITVGENDSISKEQVVNILAEQLKPVLINIVNEEIYEEGEDTYEY